MRWSLLFRSGWINSEETRHTLGWVLLNRSTVNRLSSSSGSESAPATLLWSIHSSTSAAKCSVMAMEWYQLMWPRLWDVLWIIKRGPSGCLQHVPLISHPWPSSLFTFYFVKRPSSLMLVFTLRDSHWVSGGVFLCNFVLYFDTQYKSNVWTHLLIMYLTTSVKWLKTCLIR